MKTINLKVSDELKRRAWVEATKVPQRTVSEWVREVLERELKIESKSKRAKTAA